MSASETVVLFHHAQGLLPGVTWFADRLREAGHTVHTPDFYNGKTFKTLNSGVTYRDAVGPAMLSQRAEKAVAKLPSDVVYAGMSLGAALAQLLAQTRPGARGAVFLHGVLSPTEFDTPWPAEVPAQIHTMDKDPWVDLEEAQAAATLMRAELFTYPGATHLFADPDLDDYDEQATELMLERLLAFLQQL